MSRDGGIEVVGHGGAGAYFPGNSRRSIERALEIGVDRIECDVQRTADGVLILGHDEHVVIGGVKLAVRGLPLERVRVGFDDLLTLNDFIELVGGEAALLLDLKAPGYEPEVATAIHRHAIRERTIVSSTYALSLLSLRSLVPGLSTGLSTGHLASGIPIDAVTSFLGACLGWLAPRPLVAVARRIGAGHLMVQHRVCSPQLVKLAHQAGIRVYPWTVDGEERMGELIALGVDGIITNRPDLLKARLAPSDRRP